eukprot:c26001_g1_i1 orf=104-313(+)
MVAWCWSGHVKLMSMKLECSHEIGVLVSYLILQVSPGHPVSYLLEVMPMYPCDSEDNLWLNYFSVQSVI